MRKWLVWMALGMFVLACSPTSRRDKLHEIFWKAREAESQNDPVRATVLYQDALNRAVALGDSRMEGFCCQQLSLLFAGNFDHEEALVYARRSIRALESAGEEQSADYSRMDLARQYLILGRNSQAASLVDSLLNSISMQDSSFVYYISALKGDLCYELRDYKAAESWYGRLSALGFPLMVSDYGHRALTAQHLGHSRQADSLFSLARNRVSSPMDSLQFLSLRQELFTLRGRYTDAYDDLIRISAIQDRAVTQVLSQSTLRAMKGYFEQQYKLEKTRRQLETLLFTFVFLVLVLIIRLISLSLRRSRRQVADEMLEVRELKDELERMTKDMKLGDSLLSTLLNDKIRTMDGIAAAYLSWSDKAVSWRDRVEGPAMREEIIADFREELRAFRSDSSFFLSLEEALNRHADNIMVRLREDTSGTKNPKIKFKEQDYKYLTLFYSGFSSSSIAFMMDSKSSTVRSRKFRYKELFLSMQGTPAGDEYIKRLF